MDELRKPLRLWPGVVAVLLLWLSRFGLKALIPGFQGFMYAVQGALILAIVLFIWWLFFSRARWADRLGALALMAASLGGVWLLRHESMGPHWLFTYAIPVLFLAFVASLVAARRLAGARRRSAAAAALLLSSAAWLLVRTEGITGDHDGQFHWRWSQSPEQILLAQPLPPPSVAAPSPTRIAPPIETSPAPPKQTVEQEPVPAWPGFRGPNRDSVVPGLRIATDWSSSPPSLLWRKPVGPGWSSFAIRGDLLYTQEQRGEDELVTCYNASTGQLAWAHRNPVRFFESNAGAGPRGTPTLHNGRVYALGATGILNALEAATGALIWSRNAASDTGAKLPVWGFSGSPLLLDDLVIVAASGQLAAYDPATGKPLWIGQTDGESYSSPHRFTSAGSTQILMLGQAGITSVVPATGAVLWQHKWSSFPMVQPALTPDGDGILLSSQGKGTRRITVSKPATEWSVQERWTSNGLKPYFNDFVIHKGHAFGFDGRILACIDLNDGARKWKGGRYGNGQLLLLPDQDLLLVLSEEGELALVSATTNQFTELARIPAIEGKTWNHPALAGNLLVVRNAQEMAAFRLPPPR